MGHRDTLNEEAKTPNICVSKLALLSQWMSLSMKTWMKRWWQLVSQIGALHMILALNCTFANYGRVVKGHRLADQRAMTVWHVHGMAPWMLCKNRGCLESGGLGRPIMGEIGQQREDWGLSTEWGEWTTIGWRAPSHQSNTGRAPLHQSNIALCRSCNGKVEIGIFHFWERNISGIFGHG